MKHIILKELHLKNFKGEKDRTTRFGQIATTISGCNGLGKTRHFEAFLWLLFGKDSLDRKDYEVKTRVNGLELHKVECSVEGVIEVDGQELRLKRALQEDWVKPRGKMEQVFKGNRTECWWDEAPVSVTEYTKRVKAIIDESVFKMLTNPAFFASMPWKLQREQLFQLAGTISDEEIAASRPEFRALLDAISGKTLADFKAERAAKKKRLVSELEEITPRIDQTLKLMPEKEDVEALNLELQKIDSELRDIEENLLDDRKKIEKADQATEELRKEANLLRTKKNELLFKAKEAELKRCQEENAEINALEQELTSKSKELERAKGRSDQILKEVETLERHLTEDEKKLEDLRSEWKKENAREFEGETICPYCHQSLPKEAIEKAEALFFAAQDEKCQRIARTGQDVNERIRRAQENIKKIKEQLAAEKDSQDSLENYISDLKSQALGKRKAEPQEIREEDILECREINEKLLGLESLIAAPTSVSQVDEELKNHRGELFLMRSQIEKRILSQDAIKKGEHEVQLLEKKGRELAQKIADIEKEELLMREFSQAKATECENRINSLFSMVTFKLYDETLDGNPIETCIPLVDGVPYGSANTAGQVNSGLDIINALTRFYGITAPIFIDRRESITNLIKTESQIINLVVSLDKELIVAA